MPDDLLLVVITSGIAAVASVVGGLLALWHRSSTLVSSLAFGVASGALIGTVTLEMLPTALDSGGLAVCRSSGLQWACSACSPWTWSSTGV